VLTGVYTVVSAGWEEGGYTYLGWDGGIYRGGRYPGIYQEALFPAGFLLFSQGGGELANSETGKGGKEQRAGQQ